MSTKERGKENDLSIIIWFLKPYWHQAFFVFLLLFVYALLDTITVGALYPFVSGILSGNTGTVQYGGRFLEILDAAASIIPYDDKLIAASIFLLIIVILSHIFGVIAESLTLWYHLRLYSGLQDRIYEKILRNHYSYFSEKKQGELMYIGREASLSVGEVFFYFPKAGIEFFRISIITILLLSISIRYTIITYLAVSVFGLAVYVLSNKIVNPAAHKAQVAYQNITNLFSESIAGIRQIKLHDNYSYWFTRFSKETEKARRLQFRYVAPSYFPTHLILATGTIITICATIYIKVKMPNEFNILLPIMVVYIGAVMRLMPSISNISQQWMGLKGLAPRLRLTYETLTDSIYVDEDGKKIFTGLKKEVMFNKTSFSYPTRNGVLKDIYITIPLKKTVAIVGESGSGKSTFADLLVRLYSPSSGAILVDGIDYLDFSRSSWLKYVGMVSQDTFIFHASLKENIRIGKPDATEEEIREAARIANADQFIQDLPEGYDTVVGDRGVKLSGGQRQRIAIARALIRNPEILILDEATSSLDNISEKIVQESLKESRKNQTTLIIAHRLSTVEHADKIVVLNNGAVAEEGTHHTLLEKGGFYYNLYQREKEKDGDRVEGGNE